MGSVTITTVDNLTKDSEPVVREDTTDARIGAARPPMRRGVIPQGRT